MGTRLAGVARARGLVEAEPAEAASRGALVAAGVLPAVAVLGTAGSVVARRRAMGLPRAVMAVAVGSLVVGLAAVGLVAGRLAVGPVAVGRLVAGLVAVGWLVVGLAVVGLAAGRLAVRPVALDRLVVGLVAVGPVGPALLGAG